MCIDVACVKAENTTFRRVARYCRILLPPVPARSESADGRLYIRGPYQISLQLDLLPPRTAMVAVQSTKTIIVLGCAYAGKWYRTYTAFWL